MSKASTLICARCHFTYSRASCISTRFYSRTDSGTVIALVLEARDAGVRKSNKREEVATSRFRFPR
jgi:hypothetical protein